VSIFSEDITRGLLDRKRPLVIRVLKNRWDTIALKRKDLINKQVLKYAQGISKATGLELKTVLNSKPVKKYRDKIWFREG